MIMSKTLKCLIVVFIILSVLFTASMLIASYTFKPTVTLNYHYANIDLSFITKEEGTNYKLEDFDVVRFSHYEPSIPTRSGYTFAGWYRDIGYTVAWINGRDTVTKDITLYAKWIKD